MSQAKASKSCAKPDCLGMTFAHWIRLSRSCLGSPFSWFTAALKGLGIADERGPRKNTHRPARSSGVVGRRVPVPGQLAAVVDRPASIIEDVYGVDVGAGFEVVGEADSGEDAVRVVRSVRP